jgi:hypothetical protein
MMLTVFLNANIGKAPPNLLDVVFTHYEQPQPQPFQRSQQLTGTRTFDVQLSESIETL